MGFVQTLFLFIPQEPYIFLDVKNKKKKQNLSRCLNWTIPYLYKHTFDALAPYMKHEEETFEPYKPVSLS